MKNVHIHNKNLHVLNHYLITVCILTPNLKLYQFSAVSRLNFQRKQAGPTHKKFNH